MSENDAFGCSCKHCFHVVQSRRWSKMWSSPFRWDMDAIRKSRIRLRINSFSAVIIAYFKVIVKSLLSTLKICIAVVKEKPCEKSWIYFRKSAGLSLSSVVCCCANRRCNRIHPNIESGIGAIRCRLVLHLSRQMKRNPLNYSQFCDIIK